MAAENRTKKSVRNSVVSLFFFSVRFILNFYSRKIFLDYLGTEILGLNTTAVSILQFLNLAEMGIGTAVGFTLYKPIYDGNEDAINEIVSLQGHLYRRIAYFIILGSCVVMCFFPLIFHKIHLPLWYAYASFGVLLYSALLGYFVNYRQIVLSASQMDYKIQYSTNTWLILKLIFQIIAVQKFSHPYVWWLALEALFASISAIGLNIVTKRTFPFLKKSNLQYKELKQNYSEFLVKIKQLFIHQIGAFALGQSTSLIIYGFASLSLVAIYGNYLIIVNGVMQLMAAVFNSIGAGIGNLVAEGNKERKLAVFRELFSLRFLLSSTIAFCLIACGQEFIGVWIGKDYLLPMNSLIIIALTLFIRLNRFTVNNFIQAHGLFQDIWAPIAEAGLNIGLSILLGYYWGLNGILLGALLSLIIIVDIWKPYFLFRSGLKEKSSRYFVSYGLHLVCAIGSGVVCYLVVNKLVSPGSGSWVSFIERSFTMVFCYVIVLTFLLLFIRSGIVYFFKRVHLIKR